MSLTGLLNTDMVHDRLYRWGRKICSQIAQSLLACDSICLARYMLSPVHPSVRWLYHRTRTPGKRATAVCVCSLVFLPSHLCLTPPVEERLAISTQSIHCWKVHLVGYNILSLTIRVCLHSFSCYCPRHSEMSRNSKRIWSYSSSRSSKVIDLGVNGKHICDFLLVINCHFSRICYRFREIDT